MIALFEYSGSLVWTGGGLVQIESIAECSDGAFCNTFDLYCIKQLSVLKTYLGSSFE